MRRTFFFVAVGGLAAALLVWGGYALYRTEADRTTVTLPTTTAKRGDVTFSVAARGELQGGNSEKLSAPMTGGSDMVITHLRQPGELVEPGETIVQFDTTQQEFDLREAEADLAEAEQQVIQAKAESAAKEEESRYALLQAQAQVRLAELECRKNPLVAPITAKQNDLALGAARDRLQQLQHDLSNQQATSAAAIAIQEAARKKAQVKAETAQRNIDSMTLRAKSKGYVAIEQNTRSNFMYWGMQLPILQVGDEVRAGMAVAQIPDLENWEVTARIGELDRGHLEVGQPVKITVIAVPGKQFSGNIKNIGGTTGPPWDRRFECRISLDRPSPELRQGMSVELLITTGTLENVLWVPSQAVFESDGRTFVYALTDSGFLPRDVKLVRQSESQVVLDGVEEGITVALASPDQAGKSKGKAGGVMEAIPTS